MAKPKKQKSKAGPLSFHAAFVKSGAWPVLAALPTALAIVLVSYFAGGAEWVQATGMLLVVAWVLWRMPTTLARMRRQ